MDVKQDNTYINHGDEGVKLQRFQYVLELSKLQLKKRLLYTQGVIQESHGNHKPKTCITYTKLKRKKTKYNTKESHQPQGKEQEKRKGTENYKKQPENN